MHELQNSVPWHELQTSVHHTCSSVHKSACLNLPIKSGMESMNCIIATRLYTLSSPLSTVTISLHGSLPHFHHMLFSSLAIISTSFVDAIILLSFKSDYETSTVWGTTNVVIPCQQRLHSFNLMASVEVILSLWVP